ncbi:MAG: formate dehydrogenase accessory protein FdhE [Deltaproteobacteria bacterium]|nr:MAG: formate dehydrogenase accessory protein FdhE [Deltaproteobacteria bacterium]
MRQDVLAPAAGERGSQDIVLVAHAQVFTFVRRHGRNGPSHRGDERSNATPHRDAQRRHAIASDPTTPAGCGSTSLRGGTDLALCHMGPGGLVLSREAPPAGVVAELASRLGEAESALLRVITALAHLEPVSTEIAALAAVQVRPAPPCIRLTALPVHADAVGMRFAAVVDLLAEEGLLAASSHRALRARTADVSVLVRRWIGGGPACDGRDALALRIAGVAMRPLLRHLSLSLEPPDGPASSASRRCPYCAGGPDFATTSRMARVLYCARCDAAWRAPRAGCAFCGESRVDRLAFRRAGEPPYGLQVCASCRHYLKSVEVPVSGYLAIERALSAPLDSGARATGLVG